MPDELWDAVRAHAEQMGLTAGEFVRLAVEEKVGVPDLETVEEVHRMKDPSRVPKIPPNPKVQITTTADEPFFRCPVYGCAYTARSPGATCAPHGRRVVPA